MTEGELDHARQTLREAFTAGWQAALGMNITSPGVLAVIESCFDLWLEEAVDEEEVLGLAFRGREDLPGPAWRRRPAWARSASLRGRHRAGEVPLPPGSIPAPRKTSESAPAPAAESARDSGGQKLKASG
jgi:hypothetical protein